MILSGLSLIMIIASIPALIIAAAGHEYAHAKAADLLGDPTPRMMGRLTMNPFVHLDLIGSLALIIGGFGWAKPVVVNPTNFKDPRTDDMIVSIAGPMANLVMAFIGYAVMRCLAGGDLVGNDYLNNWFDDQWHYYVECDIAYYYGKALREGVFDQSDIELMIEIAAEQINHIYPKVLLGKIRRELKFQN